jgi:N-methylhydantoinase A
MPVPATVEARSVEPAGYRDVVDPASGEVRAFGLFDRETLRPGDRFAGPALIVERETTSVVSPAFDGAIDGHGYIILTRRTPAQEVPA